MSPPADDASPGALLELAVATALEAADLVRRRRAEGVEVADTKSSPVDIVTEVDRDSERQIYASLLAARPGDGFLGEEGASAESASGVTWIVDPIDGTVNFLYGVPAYAVSIAAAVDGQVVAGVVVDVPAGGVFTATLGGGAYLNGRPLHVAASAPPMAQRLVGVGFNYLTEIRALQGAAVARLLPQVRDVRRIGSSALDLCSVAAGRLDAFVEEGLHAWDVAAGGLVAREAGARLETRVGAGGTECLICAPADGFADLLTLVARCGFLRE